MIFVVLAQSACLMGTKKLHHGRVSASIHNKAHKVSDLAPCDNDLVITTDLILNRISAFLMGGSGISKMQTHASCSTLLGRVEK